MWLLAYIRKAIHPALLRLMKQQRRHELHMLNPHPQVVGNAVYAINHSCRYDMPYAAEAIRRHTYVLVGRQRLNVVDRIALFLNGAIYVDRKSRPDKTIAKNKMKELVLHGKNLCIFPEGTWNLTPSKPMLPLYWGIIDIARETKRPIIPLILEYEKEDCYIKWGEPLYVTETDTKQKKIEQLSDEMASLKWDIWEMLPSLLREELDGTEWEKEKCRRLAECPKADYEYERSVILKVE